MLSARLNEAEDEAEGGPICMRCSSYDECDGHSLLLSDLLALPAAASARTSTCSVLNVKTVVTASINTRPQDGCWSACPRFPDGCSSCGLLAEKCGRRCSSTDAIFGQDALGPSCAACCEDTDTEDKVRATFVVVVVFSQENTRLSTNCDSSAAEKKLSPTPLHYPLAL